LWFIWIQIGEEKGAHFLVKLEANTKKKKVLGYEKVEREGWEMRRRREVGALFFLDRLELWKFSLTGQFSKLLTFDNCRLLN